MNTNECIQTLAQVSMLHNTSMRLMLDELEAATKRLSRRTSLGILGAMVSGGVIYILNKRCKKLESRIKALED